GHSPREPCSSAGPTSRHSTKRGTSEPVLPTEPPAAAVGIDHGPIERPCPDPLPCRYRPSSVGTDATGGPRPTTSALVPCVEDRRGPAPALEALDRIEQPVIVRAEMFTPQPQPEVSREPPSPVAGAGGITGLPEIFLFVEDGDGQLRIVRPGPAVHVVGPDQGHDVIDDHHLGVDVDGIRVPVLQVEDREPIRRHLHEVLHHRELAESTGGTRDPAVAVRVAGNDDDQPEVRSAPEGLLVE